MAMKDTPVAAQFPTEAANFLMHTKLCNGAIANFNALSKGGKVD